MPESKKCSIKSVALAVTTQKQSTSQTVQKQWSKQMQSTIKTSEEAKIRRIEKKKKRKQEEIKTLGNKKTEKVLLKTKQEFLSLRKKVSYSEVSSFFELSEAASWNIRKKVENYI